MTYRFGCSACGSYPVDGKTFRAFTEPLQDELSRRELDDSARLKAVFSDGCPVCRDDVDCEVRLEIEPDAVVKN